MASSFAFEVLGRDGDARLGEIATPRGTIRTPAFMPVGTQGTVKAMMPESVQATGADILLANTYHLMLRPGAERVSRLGGLHKFMNWPHPILTDSGGFQVMSLAKLRKLGEDGVEFRSHVDGAKHFLSPERAVEIQCLLGADIQMVLDECTSYPVSEADARASMELSMRWARRCRDAFGRRDGRALFGIVQGSVYEPLRLASIEALVGIGFDGYAVGGLAVGEGWDMTARVLEWLAPHLPETAPRYLMGVGKPVDIVMSIARGIDMFDCVLPTRSGRHGLAFTRAGEINLRNAPYADDPEPLDAACRCPACRQFSRAYLHHLFRAGEYLAAMLLTWHNVQYYQDLMSACRNAIAERRFRAFVAEVASVYRREAAS